MRAGRGRTIALLSALAGLASAAVGAAVGKDALVEWYYLLRLRSSDEATRLAAADRLAEMKSVAAVPHLIRIIEGDDREDGFSKGSSGKNSSVRKEWVELRPMAHALWRLGELALPEVTAALTEKKQARQQVAPGGRTEQAARTEWVLHLVQKALRSKLAAVRLTYGDHQKKRSSMLRDRKAR